MLLHSKVFNEDNMLDPSTKDIPVEYDHRMDI